MAKLGRVLTRRAGPWGTALAAWEIWKRIPPRYRARLLKQARKHGPTIVMATHSDRAAAYGDYIVRVDDGRVSR